MDSIALLFSANIVFVKVYFCQLNYLLFIRSLFLFKVYLAVINKFEKIFSQFDIPKELLTDNGSKYSR